MFAFCIHWRSVAKITRCFRYVKNNRNKKEGAKEDEEEVDLYSFMFDTSDYRGNLAIYYKLRVSKE